MRLLLHACCGPCSLEPVRLLRQAGHDIAIFYANSNIAPRAEHDRRLDTLLRWAHGEGIRVIEGAYDPDAWEACAGTIGQAALKQAQARRDAQAQADTGAGAGAGAASAPAADADAGAGAAPAAGGAGAQRRALCLDIDPELRKARCRACYRLRLEETAQAAEREGFDGIATTLSVSPYQFTDIIRQELGRAAEGAGVAHVFEDFRPFYDAATRKSRELGMYRQNYCGCRFSAAEAAAERAERKAARAAAREAWRAQHADELAAAEKQRAERAAQRAAYDAKQAKKRAVLKALREQAKKEG